MTGRWAPRPSPLALRMALRTARRVERGAGGTARFVGRSRHIWRRDGGGAYVETHASHHRELDAVVKVSRFTR